jgi:hypothetical protein
MTRDQQRRHSAARRRTCATRAPHDAGVRATGRLRSRMRLRPPQQRRGQRQQQRRRGRARAAGRAAVPQRRVQLRARAAASAPRPRLGASAGRAARAPRCSGSEALPHCPYNHIDRVPLRRAQLLGNGRRPALQALRKRAAGLGLGRACASSAAIAAAFSASCARRKAISSSGVYRVFSLSWFWIRRARDAYPAAARAPARRPGSERPVRSPPGPCDVRPHRTPAVAELTCRSTPQSGRTARSLGQQGPHRRRARGAGEGGRSRRPRWSRAGGRTQRAERVLQRVGGGRHAGHHQRLAAAAQRVLRARPVSACAAAGRTALCLLSPHTQGRRCSAREQGRPRLR